MGNGTNKSIPEETSLKPFTLLLVNWKLEEWAKHTCMYVIDPINDGCSTPSHQWLAVLRVAFTNHQPITNDGVALYSHPPSKKGPKRHINSGLPRAVLGHYSYDCCTLHAQETKCWSAVDFWWQCRNGIWRIWRHSDKHIRFSFLNEAQDGSNTSITLKKDLVQSCIPTRTWILLDNQSTMDVFFHNENLLERIQVSDNGYVDIHHCNTAGVTSTNLVGDLPGAVGSTMWHSIQPWGYHPKRFQTVCPYTKSRLSSTVLLPMIATMGMRLWCTRMMEWCTLFSNPVAASTMCGYTEDATGTLTSLSTQYSRE